MDINADDNLKSSVDNILSACACPIFNPPLVPPTIRYLGGVALVAVLVGGCIYKRCATSGRRRKKARKKPKKGKVEVVSEGPQTDSVQQFEKLKMSENVIDSGSDPNTVVFEGVYDDERTVAVKRFPRNYHAFFKNEIHHLRITDWHENVVRCHGHDADQDYYYLTLDRCLISLEDLIINKGVVEGKDFKLWSSKPGPCPQSSTLDVPSPCLLNIMRGIACGLNYFHGTLGVVHLHLEPKHVLVANKERLSAKISNLGFTTGVGESQPLFTDHGFGIRGWYHPKEKEKEDYMVAMDLFSLGCMFFFCITGGSHPYGMDKVRAANIFNGIDYLFMIDKMPEAHDLISQLLNPIPEMRPRAADVLCHLMFWDSDVRLGFLSDASDRFDQEQWGSAMLQELENMKSDIWQGNKWDSLFVDPIFIPELTRFRTYDSTKVEHLLRFVRNKRRHYEDFLAPVKTLIGGFPEGLDNYFSALFPRLLINVHGVISKNCRTEEIFRKYY